MPQRAGLRRELRRRGFGVGVAARRRPSEPVVIGGTDHVTEHQRHDPQSPMRQRQHRHRRTQRRSQNRADPVHPDGTGDRVRAGAALGEGGHPHRDPLCVWARPARVGRRRARHADVSLKVLIVENRHLIPDSAAVGAGASGAAGAAVAGAHTDPVRRRRRRARRHALAAAAGPGQVHVDLAVTGWAYRQAARPGPGPGGGAGHLGLPRGTRRRVDRVVARVEAAVAVHVA